MSESGSRRRRRLRTLAAGVLPGVMIGTGGGVLVGLVADDPDQVAAFVAAVGVVVFVLGGLAWTSAGSLGGRVSDYAGDRDFDVKAARENALRLAGFGAGLLVGAGVTWLAV